MLVPDTVQAPGESGVGISMTIYCGSVKKMPGHIKVSTESLVKFNEGFKLLSSDVLYETQPIPYRFISHGGKIYYVNGRKQIYETDVKKYNGVVFVPVANQFSCASWKPVQFRPITYLEWVFL